MKSLRQVKEEKDRLATEVDAEEEYLTSRLQSQLKQVRAHTNTATATTTTTKPLPDSAIARICPSSCNETRST